MSHQADGHSKIDQVQKCFCKVWRSIENFRVDWGDHFWRYLGDSRTPVQDRQNYSSCVQQLARRKLSISAENRNFSCLGAPVLKLGATWACTTIRRKVSWWTRTTNTYRIPRIHYEPLTPIVTAVLMKLSGNTLANTVPICRPYVNFAARRRHAVHRCFPPLYPA